MILIRYRSGIYCLKLDRTGRHGGMINETILSSSKASMITILILDYANNNRMLTIALISHLKNNKMILMSVKSFPNNF